MDFNETNYILTTTGLTLDTNSILAENIINPDLNFQYFSSGNDSDLTTTSITYTFGATTSIDRLVLMDHNFKKFKVFYNGATANSITLLNAPTTTLDYTGNSDTSQYFTFDPINMTSLTIEATETMTADEEKYLSFLYASKNYFRFTRIPSAQNYKPNVVPRQIVHTMADGGTKIHNISEKFAIDIKFKYLETAERDQLETIYNLETPFYFAPFPTCTGWDEIGFEANWPGVFDFNKYSDNAISAGFSGQVKLRET